MHILLTDVLTCPRCGPQFGLILLADSLDDRRVRSGSLGCANCRDRFPIEQGRPDLRHGSPPEAEPARAPDDPEWPLRTAALLGLAEGVSPVLVLGPGAEHAEAIGALVPHTLVVGGRAEASADEVPAGEQLLHGVRLPFRDRALRGVVLTGAARSMLAEAVRVLAPDARLVVDPAASETAAELERLGLAVLLREDGVVVASRPPRG